MTCGACSLQALECNAQGRKVARGKKKGRRTALYFRLIRPASGLHAHDMQAQGILPFPVPILSPLHLYLEVMLRTWKAQGCLPPWRNALQSLPITSSVLAHLAMIIASPCVFSLSLQCGLMGPTIIEGAKCIPCMQAETLASV